MNIFSKVTMETLKKNPTRTIVTIIGVMLSVSLITAITTFISSFQNYMIQNVIALDGDWHVKYLNVDNELFQKLSNDNNVEAISISQDIGYSILKGSANEYKPYLFLSAFNDNAFKTIPLKLLEGRLPENEEEVVISTAIRDNGRIAYEIGDKLLLSLGDRMIGNDKLGQNAPLNNGEEGGQIETFIPRTTKTCTVVGVCERPNFNFENYEAPGYTVISKLPESSLKESDKVNIFVKLKNPSKVYSFVKSFVKSFGENYNHKFNNDLLRYIAISDNDNFIKVLYYLAAILIVIIMIGSILLIHNSFSISVSERTKQFGILSSIGATKKQLRKSVLFEGLYVGIIGIPLGIMLGIAGIFITFLFINDIFVKFSSAGISLKLTISYVSIIIALIVGMVTILISAYIPAIRASKLSAINAIRQTNDIKIQSKQIKTSKLVQKIFGLEGTLALKNFKRNRKGYRSIMISLFVSVVLFISSSAFNMYLKQGTLNSVPNVKYDILFSSSDMTEEELIKLYGNFKTLNNVYESGYYKQQPYNTKFPKEFASLKYLQFFNGDQHDDIVNLFVNLLIIDDETYLKYVKELNLDPVKYNGNDLSNLISTAKIKEYDKSTDRFVSIDIFKDSTQKISLSLDGTDINISYIADKAPKNISSYLESGLMIFVPYSSKDKFINEKNNSYLNLTFLSTDPNKSVKDMETILKDKNINSGYQIYNVAETQESNRSLLLIVNVFTYGFIILISLITIANVFNTISTNINLRKREFAMLKSVGMTDHGFNKMMNFECVFYGLKVILYGLPVSIIITVLIYKSVMIGADVPFTLPWSSILVAIFSVFIVVFITMLYSINKVKKENTVDVLKNDIMR